jgi:HK97 family phage major capsid protein
MEQYAMPAATQTMLDDAFFDVEAWLAEEVSIEFLEMEGDAFVNGDGVNKPRGFLAYSFAASTPSSPSVWGKIGYTPSGASGAFAADPAGGDALIDLVHSLKPGYRANATWLMNDATAAKARKLKDSQGHYQWQQSLVVGAPSQLLGYGVEFDDGMPDFGANTYPIAFGDFNRGYNIIDRMGTRVLRDPYSVKPYILFYTTRRVGGGVRDFNAIKVLKASAS